MAFFTAFVRCVTVSKGVSSLVIYKYAPNTSKVGIKLSKLIVLLRALNTIYRVISLLILGSLTTII